MIVANLNCGDKFLGTHLRLESEPAFSGHTVPYYYYYYFIYLLFLFLGLGKWLDS